VKYLSKTEYKYLINGLIKDYALYGPVLMETTPAYAPIDSFKELRLGLRPTHISAKEFLFPTQETLITFDIENQTTRAITKAPKQAIIGLAPCDLHAISLMDRVFKAPPEDINYTKRRDRTLLIGADCQPDSYCFCDSVNTATIDNNFDLFLHTLKGGVLVRIGTKKGQTALKRYAKTRLATKAEMAEATKVNTKRIEKIKTRLAAAPEELPRLYSASEDNPVWGQIGAKCTGCGSCNHVCPTCYCFDIKDDTSLDLATSTRSRHWDGCTLEDFAKVAGGHDFRATRASRLRHRMRRKFQYPVKEYDSLFCIGCGRCSRTCLVKINIAEVTNEICTDKDK